MKHEAFQDAVSMIDDRFVEEAQTFAVKRSFAPNIIKIGFAAAACAAAVFAILFFPRGKSADILVCGQNPSASPVAVRSYDSEVGVIRAYAVESADIPVKITSSEKSVVDITGGTLRFEGNSEQVYDTRLEVFGNASLVWTVPLDNRSAALELSAQTGNQTRVFALFYDESDNTWKISEKTVK